MGVNLKLITLKKDAERRIKAGHLWIFSNDIDTTKTPLKNFAPGDLVLIHTAFNKPIAIGYINPHCLLCVRILTLNTNEKIDAAFFEKRLQAALSKRNIIFTENYFRAIFGESDRLPGIVIDLFDDIAVAQINTAGMEKLKPFLLEAISTVFHPKTLLLKCDSSERKMEGLNEYTEVIGEALPEKIRVRENNCDYSISLLTGQKTGWFYDHRFNRAAIAKYCTGKNVLDIFSYCGAFTIPAAKVAHSVTAIDRSTIAIEQLQENATINQLNNIKTICGDALESMQKLIQDNKKFDVIILDPPALIKKKKDVEAGKKQYQKLNEAALQLLNPNGVLLSASCSMHLSRDELLNCIRKAGVASQKTASILEQCHQGLDHPIHPAMPETHYLKGFIIFAN